MHRSSLVAGRPHVFLAALVAILTTALAGCTDGDARADAGRAGADTLTAASSGAGTDTSAAAPGPPVQDTVVLTAADSMRRGLHTRMAPPDTVRGLYVNRWAAIGNRMWQLVDLARRTEVNALVIDVKDDRGLMLYRSDVPLVREIGADTLQPMSDRRMAALLDSLRRHDIYSIARIVVVKDPLLAASRPELTIRRRDDPSRPWLDRQGKAWLDPHQPLVWTYAVDIAREAVRLGFAEIQLDYVRFPDERRMAAETTYPMANGRLRAQVIREQLGMVRDSLRDLGVPFTIDVFGLTATDTTDMGIGQKWELFIDQADAVLPMMYPSHYAPGTYGIGNPNANPYNTIDRGLKDIIRRTRGLANAARIVPWYQDFTLGAPRYGATEVRAQIRAGEANGFPDWILWNPGSRYTEGALQRR